MKKFITPILLSLLFLFSIVKSAESFSGGVFPGSSQSEGVPANTVSCFDYYSFGSVEANLSSNTSSAVSGTSISFSGTIKNNNKYPVVDGALFVKVFRDSADNNEGNGPDVVDQFLVQDDISIREQGSTPVSFSWQIPSYAVSGDYKIATFFITSNKFNLLGLSFTDDVIGNTVSFRVVGEQTTGVGFDKTGVTVNGENHHFAAFLPRVGVKDPVTLTSKVQNTTTKDETVEINWQVSQWDAQQEENVVQEEKTTVTIPANSSKDAILVIKDNKYPVYLATGVLKWKDTKSVVGIRFVREGIDRMRINFPAVTSYPLKAGEESTLFSCLHNSGSSSLVYNGRLDLTLSDMSGNIIHEYSYSGDVTSSMMGVAEKFVPKMNYNQFVLDAKLYSENKLIDDAHVVYDCKSIDQTLCTGGSNQTIATLFKYLGLIFVALILLLIIWFMWKKINRTTLFSIFSVLFLYAVVTTPVHAESKKWGATINGYFSPGYLEDVRSTSYSNSWLRGLINPYVSVDYSATAVKTGTTQSVCGTTVPVGTSVTLEFPKHKSTDIYWNGTGANWDTPYGVWSVGAARDGSADTASSIGEYRALCSTSDYAHYENTDTWGRMYIYTPFRVNPPTRSISGFDSLFNCNGSVPDANGKITCTATATGTSTGKLTFGDTYGKFYFHTWVDKNVSPYGQCGGPIDSPGFVLGLVHFNTPMRLGTGSNARTTVDNTHRGYVADSTNYYALPWVGGNVPPADSDKVIIPEQSISCPITVVNQTNTVSPTDPVITSAGQCIVGQTYTINMKSTDPAGDQIRYSIDWDNNGTVDQTVPASGYVSSGVEQTVTRTYSTSGSKTIKIRSEDTSGNYSAWKTFSFSCVSNNSNEKIICPSPGVTTCSNTICCASGLCCSDGTCNTGICNDDNGGTSITCSLPGGSCIGNRGYDCVIDWSKGGMAPSTNFTKCTFSTPTANITTLGEGINTISSYTIPNIQSDTLIRMTCEKVDATTVTAEAVCRVNWSAVEVN